MTKARKKANAEAVEENNFNNEIPTDHDFNSQVKSNAEGHFGTSAIGKWKQHHLKAMQLIQAFGESLQQFLLQTATAFLNWTDGTMHQCFPGLLSWISDEYAT